MPPESMAIDRVLVLDDDAVVRDLLDALLSLAGYEVSTVSSGAEALAALKTHPVDAVLTDLHMPGLEGEPLARALREAMPERALLIGMSGVAALPEVRAQLDAFLSKPFDTRQLDGALISAQQHQAASASPKTSGNRTSSASSGADVELHEAHASASDSLKHRQQTVLDETILASLAKLVPSPQLVELYNLTISDVGKRHARMLAAAAAGDLVTVQREAHAIKGGCGMVGAAELAELAAAAEGGTTINTSAIAEIPAACLRLRRMLDAKLQTA